MAMQRAGTILKKYLREYGLEATLALSVIQRKWEGLAGRTIARHTFPHRLAGKTLSVTVDSPQWMHHLSFYKQELCEKLRNHGVHDIRLKLGQLPAGRDNRHQEPRFHLTPEEVRFIEDTINDLRDDELKKRFRTLLTHGLGRGKG